MGLSPASSTNATTSYLRSNRAPLWREALLISAVYAAYSFVRNQFGSAAVDPTTALRNADWVIAFERQLGLWIEPDVQDAFIGHTAFIQFWNLFYGLFHFAVTFGVLGVTWWAGIARYRFWRRTGLLCTVFAVIGYAAFPLMPPRLLGDCGPFGACRSDSPFVDTVIDIGGIWSFESSGVEAVSNQYAAMPSLHIGWALWCAVVVANTVQRRWLARAAFAYPLMTLFAIVVTANHYWLDALGGAAVLAAGWGASTLWDRRASLRSGRQPQDAPACHEPPDTVGTGAA